MLKTEQTITLDWDNGGLCPEIRAKQGDMPTRFVRICMTCGRAPYQIPDGVSAHFRCRKHDGSSVLNPAVINADGTGTVSKGRGVIILRYDPAVWMMGLLLGQQIAKQRPGREVSL